MLKIFTSVVVFFLSASASLYAQDVIPQLESTATKILGIFASHFVKVILAIFLCGSAIAYAFNKDNERIKRNAIAIGIGAIIIMSATGIIGLVWTAN